MKAYAAVSKIYEPSIYHCAMSFEDVAQYIADNYLGHVKDGNVLYAFYGSMTIHNCIVRRRINFKMSNARYADRYRVERYT